ncbi:MAG: Na+/H+ antiporter NhaC [Verrucomicrobiota bacterium]
MSEDADVSGIRLPPLWVALIPVVFLLGSMGVAILLLGKDPHMPLVLTAVVAALVARWRGVSWTYLEKGMLKGIGVGTKAIIILMVIGILIAVWMLAGVVPYLIVLGLDLLNPDFFLPAACLICAIISVSTGSSWTTASTVGVALMGVGNGLGMPASMVAGAVVSGSYFGDKMSPLSDSTNLAPAITGVELFDHIRHMAYTTAPAFGLAMILYAIVGYSMDPFESTGEEVRLMRETLSEEFVLNPLMLLPPLVIVGLSVMRFSALPAMAAAVGAGAILAVAVQRAELTDLIGVMHYGYESSTEVASMDELLSGGGLDSMMWTISLILCSLCLGGVMESARMLESIAVAVLKGIRRTGNLVAATVGTCVAVNIVAPDQYLSIIVPGRMYRDAYLKRNLEAKNLSRTVEDAGTLSSPLVPWNTCGATMMGVLMVNPLAYLPFAFFNLLTPLIAVLWGYLNIGQATLEQEPGQKTSAKRP